MDGRPKEEAANHFGAEWARDSVYSTGCAGAYPGSYRQAEQPWSNGGPQAKLAEEIIDRAWGKIERLIELSVKAQVMREMKCIMHKEAA
jgi:hypothetical protein